jgi:nucleotide-binding universal stress UspA family protein
MTKILLAVDGSPSADHAAQRAARLFGADAEFLAICVVPNPTMYSDPVVGFGSVYAYTPLADASTIDAIKEEASETAADAMEHIGIHDAEVIASVGDPAEAILEAAEVHGVDVIVVAPSEKGWFSRLLLGSVSDTVVHRATVPVLVAH